MIKKMIKKESKKMNPFIKGIWTKGSEKPVIDKKNIKKGKKKFVLFKKKGK